MNFFDDLNKLNKDLDDGFKEINSQVYDEHNYILEPYKNPEFFEGLCNMCERYYPGLPSDRNGFTQEDLNQIKDIYSNIYGNSCFENVTSLDELQYFHNLKEIRLFSFYNCKELKSVIFPKNLQIINTCSFTNCTSLKEIKFNKNIHNIETCAFYNCKKLREVIFPNKIIKLDFGGFNNCKNLEEIVIPKRFKSLMKNIFDKVDLSKVDITYI